MKYGVAPLDPWGSVPSGTRRAGAVPIGEAWAAAGPGRGLGRLETAPEVFGKKLRPNRQTAVSHRFNFRVLLLRTQPLSFPASRPVRDSNPQPRSCALPLSYLTPRSERDSNPQHQDAFAHGSAERPEAGPKGAAGLF